MIYRQAFEQFLVQTNALLPTCAEIYSKRLGASQLAGIQEYVQEMFFENPSGCVPTKYLGEDLMNDIQTKFYYPLAFLRWLFVKKHPELKKETILITIDPSYESPTNYNITLYEQKIVLLQDLWKAWCFWFKDEMEFDDWVEDCLGEMDERLKKLED